MRSKIILAVSLAALILSSGCDVMKQVGGAYNMTQCKYSYRSITGLNIDGMDLSKGLSLTYIPKITAILTGAAQSVPLNFTLNIDVSNPNSAASAALQGLQYILSIDGVDFTSGTLNNSLSIPAGGSREMPLAIGLDLAVLLKGESRDAVIGIARNFLGLGDKPSDVTFRIKPTFMLGTVPVTSPSYIPISFSFGGKK